MIRKHQPDAVHRYPSFLQRSRYQLCQCLSNSLPMIDCSRGRRAASCVTQKRSTRMRRAMCITRRRMRTSSARASSIEGMNALSTRSELLHCHKQQVFKPSVACHKPILGVNLCTLPNRQCTSLFCRCWPAKPLQHRPTAPISTMTPKFAPHSIPPCLRERVQCKTHIRIHQNAASKLVVSCSEPIRCE